MNLLDRLQSIIDKLKPGFILMIPVFLGCETADDIGIPYELETNASVKFEEIVLPMSNVIIDSLRTDGENRILVGQFQDDLSGFIKTESYFSMKYETSNIPSDELNSDLVFDSVRMSLLSPENIGNNSMMQSFNIKLLADTISNLVYLSSNKQETIGNAIGTYESQVAVDTNYLYFPLEDDFGKQLLQNALDLESLVGSTNWPALAISPNPISEVISQIALTSDTSKIFLYVTDPEGASEIREIIDNDTIYSDTTYTIQFRLDPSQTVENPHYVNVDRSGVNTSLPNNSNMIDVLAGITTSISTQPLQDFIVQQIDDDRTIIINDASLVFSLESNSIRDTLENFYGFFYRDENYFAPALVSNQFANLIMSDNALLQSSNAPALSSLNTNGDEIVINATLFFQTIYNDFVNDSESSDLLTRDSDGVSLVDFIMISLNDVTLQRTIFNEATLRIYYTEVN